MIEHLSGSVIGRTEKMIVVDVNGVGYGVEVPETIHAHTIEIGDDIRVWIHTYVREDAIRLFGFRSFEEKQIFNLLISVGDVGPKLAMAILSNVEIGSLVQSIETEDVAVIEEVPGIGPRKSKKILVELKPKLNRLLSTGQLKLSMFASPVRSAGTGEASGVRRPAETQIDRSTVADLKSALSNLGYREKEYLPVVRRLEAEPPSTDIADLIKAALTELAGGGRVTGITEITEKGTASAKLQEIF